jgi:hypothetical protein
MTDKKLALIKWVSQFAWRKRPSHTQYILDGFGASFYIRFDFVDCPDAPASWDTCDILIEKVNADDPPASAICLISNTGKSGIVRFLKALGLHLIDEKVQAAVKE